MSYGVLFSKTVHLHVDLLDARTAAGQPDLERLRAQLGRTWVAGTLVMTRLHLTFTPQRRGSGVTAFTIRLDEITQVKVTDGPTNRVAGVQVGSHEVWIRALGAKKLAQSIAETAARARAVKRHPVHRFTPHPPA